MGRASAVCSRRLESCILDRHDLQVVEHGLDHGLLLILFADHRTKDEVLC